MSFVNILLLPLKFAVCLVLDVCLRYFDKSLEGYFPGYHLLWIVLVCSYFRLNASDEEKNRDIDTPLRARMATHSWESL